MNAALRRPREDATRPIDRVEVARELMKDAPTDQRAWPRELVETVRELLLGGTK